MNVELPSFRQADLINKSVLSLVSKRFFLLMMGWFIAMIITTILAVSLWPVFLVVNKYVLWFTLSLVSVSFLLWRVMPHSITSHNGNSVILLFIMIAATAPLIALVSFKLKLFSLITASVATAMLFLAGSIIGLLEERFLKTVHYLSLSLGYFFVLWATSILFRNLGNPSAEVVLLVILMEMIIIYDIQKIRYFSVYNANIVGNHLFVNLIMLLSIALYYVTVLYG